MVKEMSLTIHMQVADATELLMKNPEVTAVRDVKLRITALRRRARVVYLPAFVVDYKFGTRFNPHGDRTPERFQAVMSGMGKPTNPLQPPYISFVACLGWWWTANWNKLRSAPTLHLLLNNSGCHGKGASLSVHGVYLSITQITPLQRDLM